MRQVLLSCSHPHGAKREINLQLAKTHHLRDNEDLSWTEPQERHYCHGDCGKDDRWRAEDDKPCGEGRYNETLRELLAPGCY